MGVIRMKDGRLLIGDVAFETYGQLERCRIEAGDEWDDEEYYFIADELRKEFPVSEKTLYNALTFATGGYTAESIRRRAQELGGKLMQEVTTDEVESSALMHDQTDTIPTREVEPVEG